MWYYLLLAVSAGLVTYGVTPTVIELAKRYHLLDDPRTRHHPAHTHKNIVPRAGGLALLCGLLVPTLVLLPLNKTIIGIALASLLTVVMGIFDDRRDVSPYVRFVGNVITAGIVVLSGVGIPFITNPLGGIIQLDTWIITIPFFGIHTILVWADLFAILWIVWCMNIVGWSSGIDGQMPGFVAITAGVLGILSLRFSAHDISQQLVASLAFITMGTFLGFLPWNYFPQKIMPGYGGKSLAGLLIATIAILSGGKVGSALLVLAIPMIDAGFILLRRILKGKSPFRADRSHLHHYLLDIGWGKRRIALFYWVFSLILGILTLTLSSTQKVFAFTMAGVVISAVALWVSYVLPNSPYRVPDKDL